MSRIHSNGPRHTKLGVGDKLVCDVSKGELTVERTSGKVINLNELCAGPGNSGALAGFVRAIEPIGFALLSMVIAGLYGLAAEPLEVDMKESSPMIFKCMIVNHSDGV